MDAGQVKLRFAAKMKQTKILTESCGMSILHTEAIMPKTKIAISLAPEIVSRLDELVADAAFRSRSQAVETAIEEKFKRLDKNRLNREAAKLDPAFEKALAEEGMSEDLRAWPAY